MRDPFFTGFGVAGIFLFIYMGVLAFLLPFFVMGIYNQTKASDADVVSAATAVGAHDFIANMDEGYDTLLEERGSNLSLGQRQLISFARALVSNPRILLLDEATANIDTHTEMMIQRALGQLLRDRTAIVIAHRLSTIRNSDRIVVLDRGQIVEEGRHEELIELDGIYAHLYSYSGEDTSFNDKDELGGSGESDPPVENIAGTWNMTLETSEFGGRESILKNGSCSTKCANKS